MIVANVVSLACSSGELLTQSFAFGNTFKLISWRSAEIPHEIETFDALIMFVDLSGNNQQLVLADEYGKTPVLSKNRRLQAVKKVFYIT